LILVSCPRIVPVTSRRADDNASSLFSLSTNLDSRSSILRFAFVTSCIAYSSGVEIDTGGLEEGELTGKRGPLTELTGKRGPVEIIRPRLEAERGLKLLFSSTGDLTSKSSSTLRVGLVDDVVTEEVAERSSTFRVSLVAELEEVEAVDFLGDP
jgi:hypothetical protein